MQYKLMGASIGGQKELKISEEHFIDLTSASNTLIAAMAIEEKYELVLANFLELEKDRLAITAEYMISQTQNYSEFFEHRSLFNRRIVNFLTSIRLYQDQIQQHVKACSPSGVQEIKQSFSYEYDNIFEYRFMESLRNYVQHRGLAVHKITFPCKRLKDNTLEFQTQIYANKDELEIDKAIKASVLNEMPKTVELFSASKLYISSISRVHERIRKEINSKVESARKIFESSIKNYISITNGNTNGLTAIGFKNDGLSDKVYKKIHLHLFWDDVRLELANKNMNLSNLQARYVSGKMPSSY